MGHGDGNKQAASTARGVNASDTLALNDDDGSLYDPELMREVIQAVKRENLQVDNIFAMHQGPLPWNHVVVLVDKAQQSAQ